MSAFLLYVCPFQIYLGLMKWDVINKKRFENGNFQIVVSPLYAH